MFQDRTLTCRDCGNDFTFSASEQEFFAEKGFTNDPSRCPSCRATRKERTRPNNYRGGGGGSSSSFRQQRQMFPAVCSGCGAETEVPFKPINDKPVYCRDCFSKRRTHSY